jgi:orotate phosphoribosyltransferase
VNFRSIAQLSDQLLHWSRRLPRDIELVAGVPRSGLLAGNLLALYLNVPLTDVDGLLAGRCFAAGTARRKGFAPAGSSNSLDEFLGRGRNVLVLDDSLLSGRSMRAVRQTIASAGLPHQVSYGAVYVLPGKEEEVDHHCEILNAPRIFEWNVLHGEPLRRYCVALEGVLCGRPDPDQVASETRYRDHIRQARPYVVPPVEIGWIVTDRPARYRAETEAWLQTQGIRYRNLVMADQAPAPWAARAISGFKADVYRSTDALLFLESSVRQAVEIASFTGRPVLCTDSMQLVHPGTIPVPRPGAYGDLHPGRGKGLRHALARLLRRAARFALPERTVAAIRARGARP